MVFPSFDSDIYYGTLPYYSDEIVPELHWFPFYLLYFANAKPAREQKNRDVTVPKNVVNTLL